MKQILKFIILQQIPINIKDERAYNYGYSRYTDQVEPRSCQRNQ